MSLLTTRLQNWRMDAPSFDRNMARPNEYGALDFFITQTEAPNSIIPADVRERIHSSMGNTVQIPVIDRDEAVISNVRSCVIGDDENTSNLFTVVFTTLAGGFTMVPTLYANNEISYQRDFDRKVEKVARGMANALDVLAIAALEAGKTQVFEDALYYQTTGNALQIPWDARMDFMGDVDAIMRANRYSNTMHVIGNAGINSLVARLAQHDIYNAVNRSNEWANKFFHYTNNLTNEAGMYASAYFVEDGNVALLTRYDRESAIGAKSATGHEWGVGILPYINIPVGTHYYESVGDNSAIAGDASADMTCTRKEYFGFSIDAAFIVAYNNDLATIPNPIIKAEVASSLASNPFIPSVFVANGEDEPVNTKEVQ